MNTDLQALLTEHQALFAGHTAFRNGLHGDGWREKGAIIRQPGVLAQVTGAQARQARQHLGDLSLVVGASFCGAVVASFVAWELGVPVAFVNEDAGAMHYHRMHRPETGQRVLIVDDLICTGRDAATIATFLRSHGQEVAGVSAWISRVALPGERLLTLAPAPFRSFESGTCPLCRANLPLLHADIRE